MHDKQERLTVLRMDDDDDEYYGAGKQTPHQSATAERPSASSGISHRVTEYP